MRTIDADALLDAYDVAHKGPPGGARKLIENAPTVCEWISVKDRLPEEDKEVLAYNGAYVFIAAYTTNPTKYWYTISRSAMRTVTYWMPIPEPPEELLDDTKQND